MIGKESISTRERFGQSANPVREVDGFLIDDQLFEGERQDFGIKMKDKETKARK